MKAKHCSLCHLPGHDRRAHRGASRKRARRNVEQGFYDATGFHPVRRSKDYDWRRVESDWTRKRILSGAFALRDEDGRFRRPENDERMAILRIMRPRAYAEQMAPPKPFKPKKLPRAVHRIEKLAAESERLREYLKEDRAAELTDLVRRADKDRADVSRIPYKSGLALIGQYGGRAPRSESAVIKSHGKKYLRWEYVLDTVADGLGYRDAETLKGAIEQAQKARRRLREIDSEIAESKRSAKSRG